MLYIKVVYYCIFTGYERVKTVVVSAGKCRETGRRDPGYRKKFMPGGYGKWEVN